jgi:hypothetical protein
LTAVSQTDAIVTGMRPRFSEREPYERGFGRIFDKTIAPGLADMEVERQRLKRLRLLKLLGSLTLGAAIVAAVYLYAPENETALGVAFVIAIVVSGLVVGSPTDKFRSRLRELVMPPVTRFLDIAYDRKVPESFGIAQFIDCKAISSYHDRVSRIQDHVAGVHEERRYAAVDAKLCRRSGKNTVTVFSGMLLSVDWPEAGDAEVLIARDHGKLFNKLAGLNKSDRVNFDDPEFEKRFEAYANDPDAARRLLNPVFLQSMVAIADGRKGQTPVAAFSRGRFLLALPLNAELFEPGSLSRSMDRFEDDMHTLLRQLTIPRRVIDILKGTRQPVL